MDSAPHLCRLLPQKMNTLSFITLQTILVLMSVSVSYGVDLKTTLGTVSGTVVSSSRNVRVFYGIPYAIPPVGDLRFKPPVQAQPWSGVRDGTKMPNSCWQLIDKSFGQIPSVDMWNANTNMSEDCLYLNLWVPETDTPKAVMVWIYGGGFWSGTSTLNVYNAQQLAARNDVIVASLNYRVGPFGFLYGGTPDCPGNVGLLDQVMALKWIKDNAENMGGDPARITIFGESAGAVSVGYHLMSPLSMDLFNNAILMSASPTTHWGIHSHEQALDRTQTLACKLGCPAWDLDETISFLRSVSAKLLEDTQWELPNGYFDVPIGPVVDGVFLPAHPTDLMAAGKVKNTSIIAGVVKDEGTFWLLYGFQNDFHIKDPNPLNSSQYARIVENVIKILGPSFATSSVRDLTMNEYYDSLPPWSRGNYTYLDAVDDISGDTLFKCPVKNFADYYSSKLKGRVFMYSFEHRVSTNTWPQWLGVAHGYEIELFLGLPWLQPQNRYTEEERIFSEDIMKRITNFAKTGDPNNGSPAPKLPWVQYTQNNQHYLVMKAQGTHVAQGFRYSQCEFWRTQVPILQQQEAANSRLCADAGQGLTSGGFLSTLLCAFVVAAFTKCCHNVNVS